MSLNGVLGACPSYLDSPLDAEKLDSAKNSVTEISPQDCHYVRACSLLQACDDLANGPSVRSDKACHLGPCQRMGAGAVESPQFQNGTSHLKLSSLEVEKQERSRCPDLIKRARASGQSGCRHSYKISTPKILPEL